MNNIRTNLKRTCSVALFMLGVASLPQPEEIVIDADTGSIVSFILDDKVIEFKTNKQTYEDALQDFSLSEMVLVTLKNEEDSQKPITAGLSIEVVRFTEREETRLHDINFTNIYVETDNLYVGEENIAVKGKAGAKNITIRYTYDSSGTIITEEILNEEILYNPIAQIIEVGTRIKETTTESTTETTTEAIIISNNTPTNPITNAINTVTNAVTNHFSTARSVDTVTVETTSEPTASSYSQAGTSLSNGSNGITSITTATMFSDGTIDIYDKGKYTITKTINMNSTAYTAGYESTGKNPGDPAYGITASGMKAQVGVVAVDPSVIPLGTELYIEGYGYAIAGDTGGAIKGNKVDVFIEDLSNAQTWGRRYVDVHILSK